MTVHFNFILCDESLNVQLAISVIAVSCTEKSQSDMVQYGELIKHGDDIFKQSVALLRMQRGQ